jgi:RimJ/RimL family protein N-acetyltransferase
MKTAETNIQPMPQELTTDLKSIVVKRLGSEDADRYLELILANKIHLRNGGLKLDEIYRTTDDIEERLKAEDEDHLAIFWNGNLVGGIDTIPTPEEDTRELSYWLDKGHTEKRIATTAVNAVVRYNLNERGVNLEARVDSLTNQPSYSLLKRLKFRSDRSGDRLVRYSEKSRKLARAAISRHEEYFSKAS